MTIISIEIVRAHVQCALDRGESQDEAIETAAASLGLDVDTVRDTLMDGWCCEIGEALAVKVCDECWEVSAAYSASMRPVCEGETS